MLPYRLQCRVKANLVEWLSVGPHHMLYYNVAVYEVGADPGWVEDCVSVLQEHQTYNVIADMALLVDLHCHEMEGTNCWAMGH